MSIFLGLIAAVLLAFAFFNFAQSGTLSPSGTLGDLARNVMLNNAAEDFLWACVFMGMAAIIHELQMLRRGGKERMTAAESANSLERKEPRAVG